MVSKDDVLKAKNTDDLKKLMKTMNTYVAQDTLLMTKTLIYIAELLEDLTKKYRLVKKRRQSEYVLFLKKCLKEGMTLKEAIEKWRERKRK